TQNENHKSSPTLPNNVITKNNTDKGGKALVQVGAFRDPNLAKAAQQKLKKLNLSYTVDELNTRKGKIYRIRTGSFATRAAAEAAAEKIKAQGLAGLIIEQK
ncbi:MAG: SPOR domain-containing protein, partial [Kingella sp. (in: b-proteobacteria)]